jgi:hypothetical protein
MDGNKLEELRELVDFLKANGIAEFDMERADLKVRIKFAGRGRRGAGSIGAAGAVDGLAAGRREYAPRGGCCRCYWAAAEKRGRGEAA